MSKSFLGASIFDLGRRVFLRSAPAGLATGMFSAVSAANFQNERSWSETLACAESLSDLDFTDIERDLMRSVVERNRRRFGRLRSVEIAPDVEPAIQFRPARPGWRPVSGATPHAEQPFDQPKQIRVPETFEDLAFAPVTVLATLLERRRITSTDLTRMYLSRLKRFGPTLRCVVTLTEELALQQARDADREIRGGRYRGPLHGIPWGAKDLLATRGIRTTWGARPYEDQTIDRDATVVQRLREAGAVLVAKLSMGALARGDTWFGGMTRNPWDITQGSSGSSAGSGSAVAAGLVGFAIGTETLGSIISPASTCGVAGLRPTYGRVSRNGAMALSWTMDKIGPMCRTVQDCVLVFNAIYGPDDRDDSVIDAPFQWNPDRDPSSFCIGYLASEFDGLNVGDSSARRIDEGQKSSLRTAVDVFRNAGVTLEPVELPKFPVDALRIILSAESATAFDDITRSGEVGELTRQTVDAWPNHFRSSRHIPAVEYLRAQRVRTLLLKELEKLFVHYDAFVSPTRSSSLTVTNLTGHPALTLKAGFSNGLPVGLMITGRLYDETTILELARLYERRTSWHLRHPQDFV